MKVLVVDDHDAIRLMLRRMLEDVAGCAIVGQAADGAEAIERATALEPDLIVMDYEMPTLNGFDATERIRLLLPQTAVIMYTSSPAPPAAEMLSRGAAAMFRKDQLKELLEAIRNWPC